MNLGLFSEQRIVGNLPYNISTPLLARLFDAPNVVDMHFMLQREVALRLAAAPGEKAWGRLSVMAQYGLGVENLFGVSANCFQPVPQVESMFVRLKPSVRETHAENLETFKNVVKMAFSQRRKTLANSLSAYGIDWAGLGLDAHMRADHATVDDYVAIANSVEQS